MKYTIQTLCTGLVLWLAAAGPAGAALYFGGDPKGLPGEAVELTVGATAGTSFESLDIVPDLAGVAGVLSFVSFTPTPALTDDGIGECTDAGCALFYIPAKSFGADTLLVTLRFTIDPLAPVGPVAFDLGLLLDGEPVDLPPGQGFEVLGIPEPASAALLAAGLLGLGVAARVRRPARGSRA